MKSFYFTTFAILLVLSVAITNNGTNIDANEISTITLQGQDSPN